MQHRPPVDFPTKAGVLIATADSTVAEQLAAQVQPMGYRVTGVNASSGEVLRTFDRNVPDVVLLDSQLPGPPTAAETGHAIRLRSSIPVIYLVPHEDEHAFSEIPIADTCGYLTTPVRRSELRLSLQLALYKQAVEHRMEHLNQVLGAIREVGHLLARERDPLKLQHGACQILQRARGYRFVWIGQPEGSCLKLITSAGVGQTYFHRIVADITPEQGARLPGTQAFHTRQPVVCRDMLHDDRYAPWAEVVRQANFRSTLAVPMLRDGQVFGALSVYADRTDYFDEEETNLLVELARDIAFGLKAIETEAARTEAVTDLQRLRLHLEDLVEERTSALSDSEAKAAQILGSSADGLCGIDLQGNVTFINPAACRLLGVAAEQVIGQAAHPLFHHSRADGTPYPAEECPAHACIRTGNVVRVDNEVYWHADGHPIPVMYAAHPLRNEREVIGAVISFVDMTARHAADEARERALAAAEHLARCRREFLANMSHEIRTPLNGVLGFAEIGRRHFQDANKARDAFDKILHSGNVLHRVINDILDFSKIEQGKLALEEVAVNLRSLLRETVDMVQGRATRKGLELSAHISPDVPNACTCDPLRLQQILINLLDNAIKFTESGSVALHASFDAGELVFEVKDTGIGIDGGDLGRLFSPFEQADGSTTRRYGGTGLGLPIVKHLVDLFQGSLKVHSTPNTGSTFDVRLPYRPAAAPPGDEEEEAPAHPVLSTGTPLAGLTLLVAEDDPINQCVLDENLRFAGARPVIVSSGREALQRVIEDGCDAFDLVLMDIQMPDMDGYEATQLIRAMAPKLPIVGQTAHACAEDRDKCLATGMVGHIAKPYDPAELIATVRRLARSRPR